MIELFKNVLSQSNIHVQKELSQEVRVIERALCLYQLMSVTFLV